MYEIQSGHSPVPLHAQVEQKDDDFIWALDHNCKKQLLCLADSIMIKNLCLQK